MPQVKRQLSLLQDSIAFHFYLHWPKPSLSLLYFLSCHISKLFIWNTIVSESWDEHSIVINDQSMLRMKNYIIYVLCFVLLQVSNYCAHLSHFYFIAIFFWMNNSVFIFKESHPILFVSLLLTSHII